MNAPSTVSASLPLANPSLTEWFLHEVRPHEPALRAYVKVRFPSLTDIDDLVQETFSRILRAHDAGGVRSAKALLFTTARNAAIDLLRRRQVVRFEQMPDIEQLPVADEGAHAWALTREHELQLLEEAVQSLPARCQEILVLKKIHGLSYAEIGARLDIKPNTISAQLTIAVLRCRQFLEDRGVLKGVSGHD